MSDLFCNICALQFGKKYVFDLHLSLVHGEKIEVKKDSLMMCEEKVQGPKVCEKEFPNHKVEKQPKCDVCNSVFKSKGNLKKHIQLVHERKKLFKCGTCDAGFTTKYVLRMHCESVHEGKKPFECDIISATFSRKYSLKTQSTIVHEEPKPFKSEICIKHFPKKKSNWRFQVSS